jgi:peptidyl-prolyl cis-trans isomerase SurA
MRSVVLAVALAAAPVAGPAAAADSEELIVDRIIAVVDNQIVLQSEVDAAFAALTQARPIPEGVDRVAAETQRRAEILDTLIAEKLLEGEVKKLRIDVTAAEVDRVVAQTMRENNLTEEQFKMALDRQGMSLADLKDQFKKQLTKMKIVQLKVKSRVDVTDADVTTAKKQAEQSVKAAGFSKVRARHILYLAPQTAPLEQQDEAKKKALNARARLAAGADFAELASAESDDPGSKARGGDLGAFGRGEMVPEFERVAFEATPGQVVGPIRTAYGWHLILVDERVMDAPGDPKKALEEIRGKLYEAEVEKQFALYLEELRRDAFIEKRL